MLVTDGEGLAVTGGVVVLDGVVETVVLAVGASVVALVASGGSATGTHPCQHASMQPLPPSSRAYLLQTYTVLDQAVLHQHTLTLPRRHHHQLRTAHQGPGHNRCSHSCIQQCLVARRTCRCWSPPPQSSEAGRGKARDTRKMRHSLPSSIASATTRWS